MGLWPPKCTGPWAHLFDVTGITSAETRSIKLRLVDAARGPWHYIPHRLLKKRPTFNVRFFLKKAHPSVYKALSPVPTNKFSLSSFFVGIARLYASTSFPCCAYRRAMFHCLYWLESEQTSFLKIEPRQGQVRSGQVLGYTPEQRVAAFTLRRYSFSHRLAIAQADAKPAMPVSFR